MKVLSTSLKKIVLVLIVLAVFICSVYLIYTVVADSKMSESSDSLLQPISPSTAESAPGGNVERSGEKNNHGQHIYEHYCSACHDTGAGEAPRIDDKLTWQALKANGIDTLYDGAINGIGGMPARGGCSTCSDADIRQAVDYMIAHSQDEHAADSSSYHSTDKKILSALKMMLRNSQT